MGAALRLRVKTAGVVPELPSVTDGSLIVTAGVCRRGVDDQRGRDREVADDA